jgi:hypothetical protein
VAVVTYRRWQRAHDKEELPIGPLETAVRAELEALGWTPLTPPGPLRTAAERACALAETMDTTQNAAYLPPLDRQLSVAMTDARAATEENALEEDREEEISDFEAERARRRPPPRAVP